MESEALNFGARFISLDNVRSSYAAEIRSYSQEMLNAVERGEITPREAEQAAHAMRYSSTLPGSKTD